jgi:hypothetical protein
LDYPQPVWTAQHHAVDALRVGREAGRGVAAKGQGESDTQAKICFVNIDILTEQTIDVREQAAKEAGVSTGSMAALSFFRADIALLDYYGGLVFSLVGLGSNSTPHPPHLVFIGGTTTPQAEHT